MSAASIIKALGGARGVCRCPAHDDRNPSLSVTDADGGRVLVHCHAGCSQDAVIDALKARGLWPEARDANLRFEPRPAKVDAEISVSEAHRTECALEIWRASKPANENSFAATYLRARGITIPVPPTVRTHSALKHTPTGQLYPAMVCAVQAPGRQVVAVHRTFLTGDGTRKAALSSPKMSLGAIAGGAVRLGHAGDSLMLTEGVEDALALMQMTGGTAWALLGTSNFKSFIPPSKVGTIILAPDADPPGDATVAEAAARFSGMGRRVLHLRPPDGQDWCDVLDTFEERAAIAEFDGGCARTESEFAAFAELVGGEVRHAA